MPRRARRWRRSGRSCIGSFGGQFTPYGEATTNASGAYTIGDLPSGTYYAMTSQSAGYVNQFFGDVWCPGQCNFGDAPSGVPIGVTAGSDVAGRDFALRRGGSISGTITGLVAPGKRHTGGGRQRFRACAAR